MTVSPKIHSTFVALAASFGFAFVAVSVGAFPAAAASRDKHHQAAAQHRVHHADTANREYWFDPRNPEGRGYVVPPDAIRGPGYVFVPGVGILGESCDLPTSACPNEYRDVQ